MLKSFKSQYIQTYFSFSFFSFFVFFKQLNTSISQQIGQPEVQPSSLPKQNINTDQSQVRSITRSSSEVCML